MSRGRDAHMWREAGKLAESGEYEGWQAIESELHSRGFPRAKLLLDNDRIRDILDEICKRAQEQRANATRT